MRPTTLQPDSLTGSVCWLLIAKIAGFALSLALPLLLVRRLDQEQYGLYKQAFLIVTTAMTVLPLGFQMSAYYFLACYPERRRETVAHIMLFNAAVGLLAWIALVADPSLLRAIFRAPELVAYAHEIGLAVLFSITGSFLETAPIANQEIRAAGVLIVGAQATRSLILIAAALWYGSVRALIVAFVLHGTIQTGVLLAYLQSRFRGFWHTFDGAMLRRQLTYAIPLGLSGILLIIETDFHSYFIARQFPAAVFAVYMVGTFQLPLIGMLQEAVNSVLIGRVSVLRERRQSREIVLVTARAARKLAAVYFPLYAGLLVGGRDLIRLLFTDRYAGSWPILEINLTLIPMGVLLLDPIYRAYPEERAFLLRMRIAIASLLMIGLAMWTRALGLTGVIALVVAAQLVERTLSAFHFGRLLGATRRDLMLLRDVGKLGIAALAAGIAAGASGVFLGGAVPLAALLIQAVIVLVVYLSLVQTLNILSADEQNHVREAMARFLIRPLRLALG